MKTGYVAKIANCTLVYVTGSLKNHFINYREFRRKPATPDLITPTSFTAEVLRTVVKTIHHILQGNSVALFTYRLKY